MFAVLKTGGKQYRVESGDVLRVEKLACEAGETIQFNDVLMVGDQIGAPFVEGAAVQATVIDQIKGEKLIHFVRRRRKHSSKRTKGHRQQLTLVRVTDILAEGADASGVKAAIGTGARVALVPVAAAPAAVAAKAPRRRAADVVPAAVIAATSAVERVETFVEAAAERAETFVETTAERVETFTETAAEQIETFVEAASERVEAFVEAAADRAETLAETVTEAVEDATDSTAGKVALAAAAVAGVAAIAAAVLGGRPAKADGDASDDDITDAAPGAAPTKE